MSIYQFEKDTYKSFFFVYIIHDVIRTKIFRVVNDKNIRNL